MYKLFTIFLLQTALILSLHAQESKEVKSELLRAIHKNDSNEVRAIASTQKSVIKSDPILESMVKAYFLAEKKALEELKEKARLQREEEALQLEQAKLAKILQKQKQAEEKRAKTLEISTVVEKKPESTASKNIAVSAKTKAVKKSVTPKPVKQPETAKVHRPKSKPISTKTVKKPQKVAKQITKYHKVKKSQINISKVDIAGQWKADKKSKKVMFKAFKDGHFKLEERSEGGILLLEGSYVQEGEELILDIEKITYNVRSRNAAVQRIYQLKALSTRQIVLLDEKGEVAYTFRR